jgi:transcription termination/antitermination protein NusG
MCAVQRSASELLFGRPEATPDRLSWFAVHTRPRYEKKIAVELQEKDIEVFLPLHSAKHQWSDRRRVVDVPLFPGYVFVRIDSLLDSRIAVLRTHGVQNFVGVRGMGTVIPDSEIEAVQAVVDHKIPFEPYTYLEIGQRVRIRGGCLDGVNGTLAAVNGNQSVIVSVTLIRRSIAMRIEGYRVEAI